jgi:hypothetical protein
MTDRNPDDDRLDALVRAATAQPTDEARLARAVLARLQADAGADLFGIFTARLRLAPAAFAALLVATPLVIARYPGTGEDGVIAAMAFGDPLLTDPSIDTFFTTETEE